MPVLNGIVFQELGGSPKFAKTKDSVTASDLWLMSASDTGAFMETVLPSPIVVNGVPLQRLGLANRYIAGFAESVSVDPFYSEEPMLTGTSEASQLARVTISYKSPEPQDEDEEERDEDDPETFLTHRLTLGAEFMTVPPAALEIPEEEISPGELDKDGDGEITEAEREAAKKLKREDMPITLLMPQAEHQFTFKSMINPPWGAIYNAIGKVNETSFLGAAKECLLFLGVDAQREFTTNGQKPWTVDYRFSHRLAEPAGNQITWNHFYDPAAGRWRIVQMNGSKIYTPTSFSGIFGGTSNRAARGGGNAQAAAPAEDNQAAGGALAGHAEVS